MIYIFFLMANILFYLTTFALIEISAIFPFFTILLFFNSKSGRNLEFLTIFAGRIYT